MKRLVPHPLADLLPMMSEAEYQALKADIARHGLADPILLFQGKILDGRNRYRACMALGKPFGTLKFNGTSSEAAALILSRTCRRNLTKSQIACVAVEFVRHCGFEHAAAHLGVNRDHLFKAKAISERSPALFARVLRGEIAIHRAYAQLRAETNRQVNDRIFNLVAGADARVRIYLNGELVFSRSAQPAQRTGVI